MMRPNSKLHHRARRVIRSGGASRARLAGTSLATAFAAMLLLGAAQAEAGTLGLGTEAGAARPLVQKVFFHHHKRVEDSYCLDRNYWWFYRPYQDAGQNYPRCMPYFHYPEQASEGAYRTAPTASRELK